MCARCELLLCLCVANAYKYSMSDITVNSDTAIRLNTNKAELIGHERCIELSNGINNSIYYV